MTTTTCPGCHGAGTEMSGTTHAGLAEHLACDECGPDCPQDCGCRVDAEPEWAESGVGAHPGAELSPSGYPSDPPALNGPQNRAERVSDAEAAEWARLAEWATEGPWVVDSDGSIGAPMAGFACGEDGHPRLDCSECGTRVCHVNVMPGEPDAAFIAAARTAVPRLLADRERLTGEASRVPVLLADKAALMGDVDRLTAERDGARLMREVARLREEATVSAALLETEIAKREAAEMRANRATADLDALESEDRRQDVQAKHWREVLRVRRELAGVRGETNDAMEVIARGLGYSPSDFPLDRWPHLAMTGDHTPVSLAEEVVGRLDQARSFAARVEAENARLREGIERMCSDIDNPLVERRDESPHDLPEVAEDLRALLADTLGCGDWITDEQAEPILASRAWAVWDRKRRARRKR